MDAQEWQLTGSLMVACNCDWGCPCNVNARPTTGKCEGGWTWHVDSGHYGATTLDGLNFAVFANWPGAIHEGGGVAVGIVDERADDEQRGAIEHLIQGRAGGPWAIFINTYELAEPILAPFVVEVDGENSSYRIGGDLAEWKIELIRNPVTGADIHPRLLMPEGLLVKDIDLFASTRFTVQTESVSYDHSGQYASMGVFDSSGP